MLTREEYEKTLIRMFDSVRTNDEDKGDKSCRGVACEKCPCKDLGDCSIYDAFEAIEIVEKWGKEHPIMTMEDKFVEVFGHKPIHEKYENCCCPASLGYKVGCGLKTCEECSKNFWKSEYKAPKRK